MRKLRGVHQTSCTIQQIKFPSDHPQTLIQIILDYLGHPVLPSFDYHSMIITLCIAFCPSCPSQHAYGPKHLNSKCTVCSAVNKLILLSKLSIQYLTYEFLSGPGNLWYIHTQTFFQLSPHNLMHASIPYCRVVPLHGNSYTI